jgi:septation ring formation regulator EzrA
MTHVETIKVIEDEIKNQESELQKLREKLKAITTQEKKKIKTISFCRQGIV